MPMAEEKKIKKIKETFNIGYLVYSIYQNYNKKTTI